MVRSLQAEWVDALPPEHPGAIQTRRDLRRINTLMGHTRILSRALNSVTPANAPLRIVEIGAGDGELLLRVARRSGIEAHVTFVDLQDLLRDETKAAFAALGWQARSVQSDALRWTLDTLAEKTDVIIANLFLHHFSDAQLSNLFSVAARKADVFIALEPRRSAWPLFCARLLALIGFSPVTCHDAPISVRAGFTGSELSGLWPREENWSLVERGAGLFSHLFVTHRKG